MATPASPVKPAVSKDQSKFVFDRKRFFDSYRKNEHFGKIAASTTVTNIEQLLGFIEKDTSFKSLQEIAYVLATVKHETDGKFYPCNEKYNGNKKEYFGDKYGPLETDKQGRRTSGHKDAKNFGHETKDEGAKYYGRGYVQITWKGNYEKLGQKCAVAGMVDNPELALEPANAYCILSKGMHEGLFRPGHSLGDYIGNGVADYTNARNIVNAGHDDADTIADYAKKFEKVLEAAQGPASIEKTPPANAESGTPVLVP